MAPISGLSIYVIARNEADRLPRTLKAVQGLADELIVVDSGSSDGTQQIAADFGARVIHHDFSGYGAQKRFAEEQCQGPWLFNLDADEVVSEQLRNEIETVITSGTAQKEAYEIPIAEVFPGMAAPHPWAYALPPVRLYKKTVGRYSPSPVHDRVDLNPSAQVGRLKSRIHHFSVRSMGEQIEKLNRYTDMQVADMAAKGRHISAARLLYEFPAQFLKAYVLRRHFLYGFYGIATAINFAYARHLRIAKHIEARRIQRINQRRF